MTPFGTGSALCAYMRLYIILPDQETVLVNARVTVAGILSALPQEPRLPEAPPTAPPLGAADLPRRLGQRPGLRF